MDAESAAPLRNQIQKGVTAAGVFETGDIERTYRELTARGVEFVSAPQQEFYGAEAVFKDTTGNWFSLMERT
jgi:predicted enzyme related to lactoylglutathione lyase